jgi:hypothetical protein
MQTSPEYAAITQNAFLVTENLLRNLCKTFIFDAYQIEIEVTQNNVVIYSDELSIYRLAKKYNCTFAEVQFSKSRNSWYFIHKPKNMTYTHFATAKLNLTTGFSHQIIEAY